MFVGELAGSLEQGGFVDEKLHSLEVFGFDGE